MDENSSKPPYKKCPDIYEQVPIHLEPVMINWFEATGACCIATRKLHSIVP